MQLQAFYDSETFTLTYLVSDPDTRDAVVIDPVLDYDALAVRTHTTSVDRVTRAIADGGLRLRWILETHAHADHLSGSQVLRERHGAGVAIGARITEVQRFFGALFGRDDLATDGSQFDRLLADGDVLDAGALQVRVLATPGHTPACVTYQIGDAIFTGDALFLPDSGTGRCDFPNGSADALYDSICRLYALPDATRVFVGHDYQPGGRAVGYETTIHASKHENIQLRAGTSREDYVAFRTARDATLRPPRLIFQSVQVNMDAGRLPPVASNGHRYLKLPIGVFG
jgi:glyoxylase-like metal-dependent hydrolase (beta-lactamase superfamily II)